MSNEVSVYSRLSEQFGALEKLGEHFVRSGLFGADKIGQGVVLALECAVQGKTPSNILRRYHIVEGKLSLKASAALSDFRAAGGKHEWHELGDAPTKPGGKPEDQYAEGTFTAPDGKSLKYRYSMADAMKEQLVKPRSRWEKRPGQMLRARVISNVCGALCPEVYSGDDDESDTPEPASAAGLDLSKTEVVVSPAVKAPEPVKVPPTINVESTVTHTKAAPAEDEKELAKMGLAPDPKPAATAPVAPIVAPAEPSLPAPASPSVKAASSDDKFEPVTEEMQTAVENAIIEFAPQALRWLRKEGTLKPDGTLADLKRGTARKILKNTASFRTAVMGATPNAA